MTLVVSVGLLIAAAIVVVVLFPGHANAERRRSISHAMGGVWIFVIVAIVLVQSRRVRRWDATARTTDLGEPLLSSTTGARLVDGRAQPGRVDLTATRILFYRASKSDGMWGQLVGMIAAGRGRERSLELRLADVASTARTQFRTARNGLDVTMTDGTVHKLALDRYGPFEAALVPQLARVRAAAAPT
jgi:hypothetical protein